MDRLLYGAAYYDEYMPEERLEQDMGLIEAAGMNVIRIAESTWAAEEPSNGVFDFSHVRRVLEAAGRHGISVIIGTPTYAVPPWLAAEHPEVLAVTERGPGKYGPRQIMDITSPAYLFHAERVIRRLMECVRDYENVIGVQLDNETKHYHTAGPNVQKRFIRYLRDKFCTVEELNREFGFNYWSNRVDCWENVPDPTGSINGSYRAEFERFRRGLVTEFLRWQAGIVSGYLRKGQFLTHNFDFEWRGHSFGVQPDVEHRQAAEALTVAGCDIYHPSQDLLTGKEIAFCGDLTRCLKRDNYLVLETQAQGFPHWTPYPGQLRLQAFSHLASGATSVMYWHWCSIHNSFETYWKGVLSHDLLPNAPYRECCTIGADFKRLEEHLLGLRKENKVAFLVSNDALEGIRQFPMDGLSYNGIVRGLYDALYELNVECDVVFPEDVLPSCEGFKEKKGLSQYALVLAPALYSASDSLLLELKNYVNQGGHLIATFKTGFANQYLTAAHDRQPHLMTECFGVSYDQFAVPGKVALSGDEFALSQEERQISAWMELLVPSTAHVLSTYDHSAWGEYAAVTENAYGKGSAAYLGCWPSQAYLKAFLKRRLARAGLWGPEQEAAGFPLVIKNGVNRRGNKLHFYFNYSMESRKQPYLHQAGTELLSGRGLEQGEIMDLGPWGLQVIEEKPEGEESLDAAPSGEQ